MADDKTPKPKVELGGTAPAGEKDTGQKKAAGAGAGQAENAAADPKACTAPATTSSVSAWVSRTFPGHENAFWGGVLGLLAAVVLFAIGILKALIVVVLVVAGIAVGQLVDGDPKLIRMLQRLFSNNQ